MYNFRQARFNNVFEKEYNSLLGEELKDGLYHITDEYFLDILIKNFDQNEIYKNKIIVCFSGAVTDRDTKSAPFFSGDGIASQLRVPLISFADPIVSASSLNLAWYAGSNKFPDLQYKILNFLNGIVEKYQAELIFLGGSGGGFASLYFATALQTKVKCLVWNPQIKIENYVDYFVDQYLDLAFNSKFTNRSEKNEYLTLQGICCDVSSLDKNSDLSLIYLQNINDLAHINDHLSYFKSNYFWNEIDSSTFISGDLLLHYGNWGEGHAMPYRHIIQNILEKLVKDVPLVECLNNMNEVVNRDKFCVEGFSLKTEYKLFPTLDFECGKLITRLRVFDSMGEVISPNFSYACYLKCDDLVLEKIMYKSSNEFSFAIDPNLKGQLFISCYVRDLNGKPLMNNFKIPDNLYK